MKRTTINSIAVALGLIASVAAISLAFAPNQKVNEAIRKAQLAQDSGEPLGRVCLAQYDVADAYLEAGDENQYRSWTIIASATCSNHIQSISGF